MRLFHDRCPLLASFLATSIFVGRSAALVDKWTPEGFDWTGPSYMRTAEVPSGIWMNETSVEDPVLAKSLVVNNHTTTEIGHQRFVAILPFLGFAWRVANIAAAGIALKDTIQTCKQTAGGSATKTDCAKGVLTTAISFGGAYSAGKKLIGQAERQLFPHRFVNDVVELELQPILRRDLGDEQMQNQLAHHDTVRHVLRSMSHADYPEPEFIGYTDDDHRLARRDGGLHPLVPAFRFEHYKLGSMELASRDTVNGTFISLAPTGSSMHLLGRAQQIERVRRMKKREEVYDHELITGGAVEARFDTEASNADPADLSVDAGQLFDTFEPEVECFIPDNIHDSSILDVQMYDQTNRATFGFASIGIYNSEEDAASIESMTPQGMPLQKCG